MVNMPDDLLINFLTHYGQNLTEQARQGRLRKAYGRDAEVEAVVRRLARPRDARPLLVGPPRVGKTAIIHEVVRRMVQGDCPESLRGVQVYELAPPQIVTALGTEWRDQLHGFLRDLGSRESTLIYFRDFPTALGAGVMGMFGGPDLATLLAQHLRGENLRCIAEARTNPMRRMSDFLPVMDEVFTRIAVEEPSLDQTSFIVNKVAEDLEIEYEVQIEPSARETTVDLTRRFGAGQSFPGKAIQLLEESAIRAAAEPDDELPVIDHSAVAGAFAERTGLSRQLLDDAVPLDEGEVRRVLRQRVIGQAQAVDAIIQTVSLVKARLNDPRRPLGVFLFLGPTGVGKTELAKSLAEWLFGDEGRLVRFNMYDYQEDWQYGQLFGDPHGDDLAGRRGQLTLRLADQPFAALLLDEFEKANYTIFQRFLQLFDEGILVNGDGELVDLRNTIMIATSNFGSQVYAGGALGFSPRPSPEEIEARLTREMESYFTPEFINRLDSVCFFKPLGKTVLHEIARREIDDLFQREGVTRRGLVIEMDEEVVERVVERGYSPKFGARHLKRQIERTIAYPLARAIISQPTKAGDLVRLYVKGGRIQAALVPDEAERAILETEVELEAEDLTRRFTVEEMRDAVDGIFQRIDQIEAFHNMDATRARMNDLIAEMSEPAFWDDPPAAEAKLATLGDLTRKVDVCEGLRRAAEDLESVLELIVEEGKTQLIGEAARRYRYLLRELPRAELDLLLTGPWDTHDAFLTIHVAPDDTDAAEWAESLARMYLGWAGRRRFETTVIDETRDHAGHLQSFAVAIRGHGAFGLLKGETGAHRRLQHREDGGRQALHARVEVIPDIGLGEMDAVPPDDVRVQSQVIGDRGEFLRRLRSQAEAVHLPSETVVTLTNDRTPDENSELCRHLLRVRLTYEARGVERPAPSPMEPFWGAVVRTYSVYKDQYVKDTRTGVTETHIRRVLEGQIDSFLEAYLRAAVGPETGG